MNFEGLEQLLCTTCPTKSAKGVWYPIKHLELNTHHFGAQLGSLYPEGQQKLSVGSEHGCYRDLPVLPYSMLDLRSDSVLRIQLQDSVLTLLFYTYAMCSATI